MLPPQLKFFVNMQTFSQRSSLDESSLSQFLRPRPSKRNKIYEPRRVPRRMRSTQYFSSAAGSGIHSSTTVHQLPTSEISQGGPGSSGTWTVSSGEPGLWSATDEVEDRFQFVQEYNRLAEKVSSVFFLSLSHQFEWAK